VDALIDASAVEMLAPLGDTSYNQFMKAGAKLLQILSETSEDGWEHYHTKRNVAVVRVPTSCVLSPSLPVAT
jgi:hypothetical protein